MAAEHIIPGIDDPTCGIAVAARQLIARGVGEDGEVWVHSMWTPLVIKASIKALLTGKKLVRMPHGCTDLEKLKFHWHKKLWAAPIERWLFRRADRIVATCEDEVNWIKAFEPRVKKVEIVRLDSHVERVDSSFAVARCSTRLLYVGRLHPLKGVEYLLEALHTIQTTPNSLRPLRSLRLKIIGKDEGEGKKLRRMAADYSLDVEFCGIVSERDKNAAYDWCDALILPTLSENFGLVIAEALARGKRVITTDGAPAWGDGLELRVDSLELKVGEIWSGCRGRLIYLKGYRDGTPEERVDLLANAIRGLNQTVESRSDLLSTLQKSERRK